MSLVLQLAALVLLLTMVVGLWAVVRPRGGVDALLAALLFGTTGVALAAVLARALARPDALNVALVGALLAAILGVAFVLRGWPGADGADEDNP